MREPYIGPYGELTCGREFVPPHRESIALTEVEVLIAGNCLLDKADQEPKLKRDYRAAFEPD